MSNALHEQAKRINQVNSLVEATMAELDDQLRCIVDIRNELSEGEGCITSDMIQNAIVAGEWVRGKVDEIQQCMFLIENEFFSIKNSFIERGSDVTNHADVKQAFRDYQYRQNEYKRRLSFIGDGGDVIKHTLERIFTAELNGDLQCPLELAIIIADACSSTLYAIFATRYKETITDFRVMLYYQNEIAKIYNKLSEGK